VGRSAVALGSYCLLQFSTACHLQEAGSSNASSAILDQVLNYSVVWGQATYFGGAVIHPAGPVGFVSVSGCGPWPVLYFNTTTR
jgi:hypothetical protein